MNNTETIVDENGVEVVVDYYYENIDHEEYVGATVTATKVCTGLKSVEIIIKGEGIDILKFMSERQQDAIISKLTYE